MIDVVYSWNLRKMMADRGMYQTTDLQPLLVERGVHLSREQVYRMVTGAPQRLNLEVFAVLCDILECSPADLITVSRSNVERAQVVSSSTSATSTLAIGELRPTKVTVRRPE